MAFITTDNPHRLAMWRRLFRSHRIPVKSAVPRWQTVDGRPQPIEAYDLDAARLLPKQRTRFRSYIARQYDIPEAEAEKLMDGWPIKSDMCRPINL